MRTRLLALLLALSAAAQPQGQPVDDRIYDEVRRKLANDVDVKGGGFNVEVKEGVVWISGKVDKEKARAKAEKIARKVKGVVRVENKLVVAPV